MRQGRGQRSPEPAPDLRTFEHGPNAAYPLSLTASCGPASSTTTAATAWVSRPEKPKQKCHEGKRRNGKEAHVPGIWQVKDEFVVVARWTNPKTGNRSNTEGTAPTLADAVALKEEMRGKAATPKPTPLRLVDFVERYVTTHAGRLAPSTSERYVGELAHWITKLGAFYFDAITVADVRAALMSMARSAAPATVNGRLRLLRQVFDDAVADGVAGKNLARAVKSLPEGRAVGMA